MTEKCSPCANVSRLISGSYTFQTWNCAFYKKEICIPEIPHLFLKQQSEGGQTSLKVLSHYHISDAVEFNMAPWLLHKLYNGGLASVLSSKCSIRINSDDCLGLWAVVKAEMCICLNSVPFECCSEILKTASRWNFFVFKNHCFGRHGISISRHWLVCVISAFEMPFLGLDGLTNSSYNLCVQLSLFAITIFCNWWYGRVLLFDVEYISCGWINPFLFTHAFCCVFFLLVTQHIWFVKCSEGRWLVVDETWW